MENSFKTPQESFITMTGDLKNVDGTITTNIPIIINIAHIVTIYKKSNITIIELSNGSKITAKQSYADIEALIIQKCNYIGDI